MSDPIILQVGVKVLLRNPEGKFLLLRRSVEKYPEVGAKWDIVGGRIDPGDTLLNNLKREIKEETQLELSTEPILIGAQDILRVEGRHVVRLTYIGEINGQPTLDEDHDEYGWFSFEEMKELPKEQLDSYFSELLNNGHFASHV